VFLWEGENCSQVEKNGVQKWLQRNVDIQVEKVNIDNLPLAFTSAFFAWNTIRQVDFNLKIVNE
jgi:hypothetical protein